MLEIIKDYRKYIISIIFILVLLIGGGFVFVKSNHKNSSDITESVVEKIATQESKEIDEVKDIQKEENVKKYVTVDIKGAVKKPGVYTLEEGSIVNDVIKLAQLKSGASTKNINLSKKVSNEMVIYVYTSKELSKDEEIKQEECVSKEVNINNCEGSSIIVTEESNSNNVSSEDSNQKSLVNINKASKEEIMTLSGIGESKAIAIIKYREDNGLFKDITEIMNVSGIGEALYNKIKDYITI